MANRKPPGEGDIVEFVETAPTERTMRGRVRDILSTQFTVKTGEGIRFVFINTQEWRKIK